MMKVTNSMKVKLVMRRIRRTKVMLRKQMDGNLRTKLHGKKDILQVQLHRFQQTRDSWLLKLLVSKKGFLVNENIHAIYVGKVLKCRSPLSCIMQRNIQMILFNVSTAHTQVLSPNSLFKHQHSHLYLKHVCDICQKRFQFPGQLQ